jgi:hypothetical protein
MAHVQFWGKGELKSFSNRLSEHFFETELFHKLIIAPKLDMSHIMLHFSGCLTHTRSVLEWQPIAHHQVIVVQQL